MCFISIYLTVSQSLQALNELHKMNKVYTISTQHWVFQYYLPNAHYCSRYLESAWFVDKQSYVGAFNLPCNVYFMQTKG